MPPSRLNYPTYLCPIEKLFRDIKLLPVLEISSLSRTKARVQDIALNAFYSYSSKRINSNIAADELSILKSLASDDSVVVHTPDKGNGMEIMNRADYFKKI